MFIDSSFGLTRQPSYSAVWTLQRSKQFGLVMVLSTSLMWVNTDTSLLVFKTEIVKVKGVYRSSWETHLRGTGRNLSYGITQCYLPPDTSERAPYQPQQVSWYSIYLPLRDGRLSWPRLPGYALAGSQTRTLVRHPNHYTTEPPVTVGQLVYFDVSCFMSSHSVFLYTFCVYSRKLVHVQWTGTVAPAGLWPVWSSCDCRMIESSADR